MWSRAKDKNDRMPIMCNRLCSASAPSTNATTCNFSSFNFQFKECTRRLVPNAKSGRINTCRRLNELGKLRNKSKQSRVSWRYCKQVSRINSILSSIRSSNHVKINLLKHCKNCRRLKITTREYNSKNRQWS